MDKNMRIKNGLVLKGQSNRFESADICISEGRISSFGAAGEPAGQEDFDAEGL